MTRDTPIHEAGRTPAGALSADERLLSRELDGELTPAEHADLRARLASESGLAAKWTRWQALDALAGAALRAEARTPADAARAALEATRSRGAMQVTDHRRRPWLRRLQPLMAAAAVALCVLLWQGEWKTPGTGTRGADRYVPGTAQADELLRWRAPATSDVAANIDPTLLDRPHAAWRETERSWIVIPADDDAGAMYVVQIDRVREQATAMQADF
jgi:hypothetical protein